jgi:hypothetical protein
MQLLEDCFVVYVRQLDPRTGRGGEWEVACYPTREEARRVQRKNRAAGRECVVRFAGVAGGGD